MRLSKSLGLIIVTVSGTRIKGRANVLDEYPDRSSDDINYAGNFPYDVLTPIGFNGAFFYARARIGF